MKTTVKILLLFIIVFTISFFHDKDDNKKESTSFEEKDSYKQSLSFSENKKNYIYTEFTEKGNQTLVISINGSASVVLENDFITFSPVINNKGDFAYAVSEYSTSESKVYINNDLIIDTDNRGLYKSLEMNNKYLVFSYSRLYDNKEFIVIYDIETKKVKQRVIDGIIQDIKFINDNKILIEVFNLERMFRNVYLFDVIKNEIVSKVEISSSDVFIGDIYYNDQFTVNIIEGSDNGRYLYNAYYLISSAKLNSDFSNANNFMGRITWNEFYRLEAMVKLYLLTDDPELKKQINTIGRNIMDGRNGKSGLNLEYNPKVSWATKKYSLDKSTPISLIVDDSLIYYSLLYATRNNIIEDQSLRNEIINNAKELYKYHEQYFNQTESLYRIPYGINFHLDGVFAPFNYQNSFGLMLIELYKLTNDQIYKTRVTQLAERFKSEMEYTDDNRLIWHYWPRNFYEGWDEEDIISENTPFKESMVDELYEDFSHAGLNVKFILEFYKNFGNDIFSEGDIKLLDNTLSNGIRKNNLFTRFISGDIEYQSPSIQFIPKYGWTELENKKLNSFYKNLLPFIYAEFDSQELGVSYVNLIKEIDMKEKVTIHSIKFNVELEEKGRKTLEYKLSDIKDVFKTKNDNY